MSKITLDKLDNFCYLLKDESIKKELIDFTEGYQLKKIEEQKNIYICSYCNDKDNKILIVIQSDNIELWKKTTNTFEKMTINEKLLSQIQKLELRPKGIIFTDVQKKFGKTIHSDTKSTLIDLTEKRYVFSEDNLKKVLNNIELLKNNSVQLFKRLASEINLEKYCNLHTDFSTHMSYYIYLNDVRQVKLNSYPTITFLNKEEISRLYIPINGEDKLYRIYDLYRGIINPQNEQDINGMHLELLSTEGFDMKALRKITTNEDSIVGKSRELPSENYINYVKHLLKEKYNYKDSVDVNRNTIINAITKPISIRKITNSLLESKLGISYNEYEQLDEQHKLIKEKTGKEIPMDNRLHIDGISLDKEHIITKEEIAQRLDKLTSNSLKQKIKKRRKK